MTTRRDTRIDPLSGAPGPGRPAAASFPPSADGARSRGSRRACRPMRRTGAFPVDMPVSADEVDLVWAMLHEELRALAKGVG